MDDDAEQAISALPCWRGAVSVTPLGGGITNRNYLATCAGEKFVVRFGVDNAAHGIWRAHELAAAQAGFAAGISPEIVHAAPGVMVSRFIEGRTLNEADFAEPATMRAAMALLRRMHERMAAEMDIPVLLFWVFQVNASYLRRLRRGACRFPGRLEALARLNARLEALTGPVRLAFCHNDLLMGNWIDDGARIWLIDWDYAGFNTPLFDLGNLAAHLDLPAADAAEMLATYDGERPARERVAALHAQIAASLLREMLWSAVSEQDPPTDFDYPAYTDSYDARLATALERFGIAAS